MSTSEARRLRQPRQPRAWATLERILDTAERLLDGRDFHELSLGELIVESGVSSSSLYARFRTKEALIDALHDRYQRRVMEEFQQIVHRALGAGSFPEIVREAVRGVLATYRDNASLIRAFVVVEWTHPSVRERRSRMDHANIAMLEGLLTELAPGIPADERREAVEAAFWLGDGVARLLAMQNRDAELRVRVEHPRLVDGIAAPLIDVWRRHCADRPD